MATFTAHAIAIFIDVVVAILAMNFAVIIKTALKPPIAIVAGVWVASVTRVFYAMSSIVEYVIARFTSKIAFAHFSCNHTTILTLRPSLTRHTALGCDTLSLIVHRMIADGAQPMQPVFVSCPGSSAARVANRGQTVLSELALVEI